MTHPPNTPSSQKNPATAGEARARLRISKKGRHSPAPSRLHVSIKALFDTSNVPPTGVCEPYRPTNDNDNDNDNDSDSDGLHP